MLHINIYQRIIIVLDNLHQIKRNHTKYDHLSIVCLRGPLLSTIRFKFVGNV